jgi:hypothetical protein
VIFWKSDLVHVSNSLHKTTTTLSTESAWRQKHSLRSSQRSRVLYCREHRSIHAESRGLEFPISPERFESSRVEVISKLNQTSLAAVRAEQRQQRNGLQAIVIALKRASTLIRMASPYEGLL